MPFAAELNAKISPPGFLPVPWLLMNAESEYLHPALHGAGDQLEKSLCPSLWRTALRRRNDELEGNLDDSFRNHRMAGS